MNPEELSGGYGRSIVFLRWGAYTIDIIFALIIPMVMAFLLKGQFGPKYFSNGIIVLMFLASLGFSVLYFWLSEGLTGSTMGKFICRLRVVSIDGEKPGLKKALIRALLRFVECYILNPTGFIVALATRKRQRIGDLAAKTFVVRTRDIPNPPRVGWAGRFIVGMMILLAFGMLGIAGNALAHQRYNPLEASHERELVVSKDKQSEILLPEGWTGTIFLNCRNAQIMAENREENLCMVTYTYRKAKLGPTVSIRDLYVAVHPDLVRCRKNEVNKVIHGYRAIQFDSFLKKELWGKEPYVVTIIETELNYHLIIGWGEYDDQAEYETLRKAVDGFREREVVPEKGNNR